MVAQFAWGQKNEISRVVPICTRRDTLHTKSRPGSAAATRSSAATYILGRPAACLGLRGGALEDHRVTVRVRLSVRARVRVRLTLSLTGAHVMMYGLGLALE